MIGQRTVSRGVFRAWHCKQWRSHHEVGTFIPIHQYNSSRMRNVRVVPRWQETVELTSLHDPRAHGQEDVDANRLVV